nr:dockerin type I domain-containing protein [Ruminococcus bromii]
MKKIISILLSALLIIVSLSGLTTVCQALDTDDTVYPGDKVTVTYSFAKDIPEGCEYYDFETNYPFEMVKYSGFKNHWVLKPWIDEATIYYYKIVPVQGMTADNSHYGPQVKAGQKIISIVYDVIKKTKVSDLNFSLIELELGINDQYEYLRDSSYISYDVKITSKNGKPVKPTTVAPTTAEPTTVAPTTEEPTTVEPTTAKLKTVKGTVKSYLSESDTVTIQLIKSGEVAYETTVKGNNAKYSISGVASGTYTMKVSKNAHADREYTVIVANSDVIRNAKIFAIGDVNSDGDISVVDATLVQKYIVGLENLTDLQKKSADVNDNNEISVVDATLIQKYIVGLDNFA